MKKNILKSLSLLLILLTFFSCSNSHSAELTYTDELTLKEITGSIDQKLIWTRELEGVRLIFDIRKNSSAGNNSNIRLNPDSMCVITSDSKMIYPILEGFGSLDNSAISSELSDFLKEFCNMICKWEFKGEVFEDDCLFTVVLFKNDIENLWKNVTGKEFKVVPDEKLFDSYITGEPYFEDNQVQVPVRFTCEKKYFLDLQVYITADEAIKINQLKLVDFNKSK